MMDRNELEETIVKLMQFNDALRADYESLRVNYESLRADITAHHNEQTIVKTDYSTLVEATRVLTADRDALKLRVIELEAINKRLTDMLWGRRSERRTSFTGQTPLDFGDDNAEQPGPAVEPLSPEIISAQQATQTALDKALLEKLEARRNARREKKNRTEEFPAHFERRVREIDLSEEQKVGLVLLGTKINERLRFEKPNVYVEQIKRFEYIKVNEPELGVQSAPAPPSIIEGCKYDFSIIAAIVTSKFGFHMPTYRQEDMFGQSGWRPSRSTMNDLINYAVDCIDPLYAQMFHSLHQQPIVLGDDTTITVLLREAVEANEQAVLDTRHKNRQKALQATLEQKRNEKNTSRNNYKQSTDKTGSATSYAWVYNGLDAPRELRPEQYIEDPPPTDALPDFSEPRWTYAPYNLFQWSLTHQHSVIDSHLANYRGVFVGDAAGGNAGLAARSGGSIIHQSCNSHARREFVKAESNDPVLASQMLSYFRQLYAIEYRGLDMTSAARLALRQRDAVPIWQRMQTWLDRDDVKRLLPKSAIGQAVGYLRNQWTALRLYLTDGAIPFDNNQSERIIRPLTIGRKNWQFLGSVQSAPGRLKLFSIVSSAHRHCLSIQDYLEDAFLRLSQAAQNEPKALQLNSPLLLSLLPDRWSALHPHQVHNGRKRERELVAENKQYYRLKAGLEGNHPYAKLPS